MRQIYPYNKARAMYNTTNGAGFKDKPDVHKAFLRQPLYDTLPVSAAAGLQTLRFFTTGGNLFKTNMNLPGQLPNGQDFLVWNIQCYFVPGVSNTPAANATVVRTQYLNDMAAIYNGNYAQVNILSAPWLTVSPLMMLPPANRLVGALSTAVSDNVAPVIAESVIASAGGEVYDVNGLWLPANTNFDVTIAVNLAGGLPSGVDGEMRIEMDGVMYRNIQ